ncbi:uncharacterized protein PAC_13604 [Phialocephala subalpina]|uniref:Uncharacterized protein n=1 Tax=Phialocephala subalpina TaxID=576137 RepID=A0A1L7XFJ1_9HELO|nr:uncharacterized protein PAC_13604 [Phialocephala subalpina]
MNKKGIRDCDAESLEELLAGILCAFKGVKTLPLVAKHAGAYPKSGHRSQLSLHDPINTDFLEVHHSYAYSDKKNRQEMETIHDIPELDTTGSKLTRRTSTPQRRSNRRETNGMDTTGDSGVEKRPGRIEKAWKQARALTTRGKAVKKTIPKVKK